ncbi:hypothetical protein [Streptomyces bluensis]|uniref:hypothetical protein n=1 Tax=Streptomyces bluensis TaxID=33897 RepID=UPI00331BA667
MAEAQKISKTIVEHKINLTLSIEEAETLMAVGAKIGGDPQHSPRKHYAAVVHALTKAGVRTYMQGNDHPFKYMEPNHRGLYFQNSPTARRVTF